MRHESGKDRHDDEDEEVLETLIKIVVVVVIVGAVIFGAAGFLDSTFGWGLQDWLQGLLDDVLSGGE